MGKLTKWFNVSKLFEILLVLILVFLFVGYNAIFGKAEIEDGAPNFWCYAFQTSFYAVFACSFLFAASLFYKTGELVPTTVMYAILALPLPLLTDEEWLVAKIYSGPLFIFAGIAFVVALIARMAKGLRRNEEVRS
jgi:hypothetical protein